MPALPPAGGPSKPEPIEIDESMLSIPPGEGAEGLVIALRRAAVAGDGAIFDGDPPPPWQPGEVLDALYARACLDTLARLHVFAADGDVQAGCRTRIAELDRILTELVGR
ncbi:MAG: hypothetical protein KF833_21415, partial [Verrucomicrobiae bacterium]|nr:hypothetical protein [Verrucomicrobiae bacterium]